MRRAALLFLALLAPCCATTTHARYGKFVLEEHSRSLGSSCLSGAHSHVLNPAGKRILGVLTRWEVSGNGAWALAVGIDDPHQLHLLDLEGGRVHSSYDLGLSNESPWQEVFFPLHISPSRDHFLLERIESPSTRSLVLISCETDVRVRTLFQQEGQIASVSELKKAFWAPDGSGLAFTVSPGVQQGPTRLFYVEFRESQVRETDQAPGSPNTVAVDWTQSPPRLR